ncbi:MAG: hypothetical protein WBP33_09180 [Saprospiraceae bacterium]|nr:hypothetical protein [Candidatus Vicinibacter proximus]
MLNLRKVEGHIGALDLLKSLNKKEFQISKSSIVRILKTIKIQARRKKKHVITTDSKHKYPVPENLLDRNFEVDQINKVWVSDITYIRVSQIWMYFKDCNEFSRPDDGRMESERQHDSP